MKIAGDRGTPNKLAVPADWDNPNPVSFLSATGSYLIALATSDLQDRERWISEEKQVEPRTSPETQACIDTINQIPKALFKQHINDA